MLNHLLYGSFLWTYDPKYIVCEGKFCSTTEKLFILFLQFPGLQLGTFIFTLCAVFVCVFMSVRVDIWCVCDCLCVKECAADTLFGHVTFHTVFHVCVGVNKSPVSMLYLHSCVVSVMLQQQFRLNLSCCGSAWKHRWALDTSARVPKAPRIYQRIAEVDSISRDMLLTSSALPSHCLATIATVMGSCLHGDPRETIPLADYNART